MKILLALLLAFSMLLSVHASATDFPVVCPFDECPVALCADMGSAPAPAAILPNPLLEMPFRAGASDLPRALAFFLPNYFKDIWTPPD